MPFPSEYMRLFNASARAIKAVNPAIKVGGPATAGLSDVPEFVAACKAMDLPFDFVRWVASIAAVRGAAVWGCPHPARVWCVRGCCGTGRALPSHSVPRRHRRRCSTHNYPSDPQCPKGDDWDPNCFTNQVRNSRQSVADYPFYLTEYNVGCCLGYSQHDTPAAAPFVFRQVGELSQELDVMSYWTFTDSAPPRPIACTQACA